MNIARQQLLQGVTAEELNQHLDNGGQVVWIQKYDTEFDVVLETYVEVEVGPEEMVLDFLAHVDAGMLDKMMLENHDPTVTVAQAAVLALAQMVRP